jgi:phage shock protein A
VIMISRWEELGGTGLIEIIRGLRTEHEAADERLRRHIRTLELQVAELKGQFATLAVAEKAIEHG